MSSTIAGAGGAASSRIAAAGSRGATAAWSRGATAASARGSRCDRAGGGCTLSFASCAAGFAWTSARARFSRPASLARSVSRASRASARRAALRFTGISAASSSRATASGSCSDAGRGRAVAPRLGMLPADEASSRASRSRSSRAASAGATASPRERSVTVPSVVSSTARWSSRRGRRDVASLTASAR
ncbi:hypothetical protein [Sorangium sp. So ce887]|uniref:hypothetical protein n=1 Tax=Sorangium sp. So ce887 TaxID=3133324 RepID=UPI003F5E503D